MIPSFKQLLAQKLESTELFEMAYNRRKAIDIISVFHIQIVKHFIKVALFPEHRDSQHWNHELEVWLSEIDDIKTKPNGRRLKYEDYYENLYDGVLGHSGALFDKVKSLYRTNSIEYIPDVDYEILHNKFQQMYEELCDDFSIGTYKGLNEYIQLLK
jgi:transcription termination factor NusB